MVKNTLRLYNYLSYKWNLSLIDLVFTQELPGEENATT